MQQKRESNQKIWEQVVAKSWTDPQFKERLMNDPTGVLEAEGMDIPSGMHLEVIENTPETQYLFLPEKPKGALSEEQLLSVSAGMSPLPISLGPTSLS